MFVNPYLSLPGNCRGAFAFYAACLGGALGDMMTHEAMRPGMMELPEGWAGKIMHASMKVGGKRRIGRLRGWLRAGWWIGLGCLGW